ncbi:MAG: UDP-N-acetylmuramate--L-alanine ligase [Aphanocapsa feldmannii 277cV]|uniref:UDP-N-acetylmuramate--L-alanine ligase n=1 Tax=Aphanocapsa feldmannii 277cV TaxID=2507553 RepID=A0A524RPB9_9CHRO|nr:MAG: UDP-N-acetylmuramate--L-alanine ligase [Aphanocapsa feldmannii 288cV]TGG93151.1 MAG: UDP-N-acetylmuramate--L-alanine ligase [Aphanocapsa feldmannii 277cV]
MPALDPRRPVHFIGIAGIGMSALALILLERGFRVSGSDQRSNALSAELAARGATIHSQQGAATIEALLGQAGPDPLVITSTAVPSDNPERAAAEAHGLECWHRADLLAALIQQERCIAVAGSHGKTTTSTAIATLLLALGRDPSAVIGGVVPAFGSNGRSGRGGLLVAEADESDGSLVKFAPALGLITNLDLDHTGHYGSEATLVDTFVEFGRNCEQVLANADCESLTPAVIERLTREGTGCCCWSVRQEAMAHYRLVPEQMRADGSRARWFEGDDLLGEVEIPLLGEHNLSNVAAAMASCRELGIPFEGLGQALTELRTPGRRFELRGEVQGRVIVDDYAHHPSEVRATLAMARLMQHRPEATSTLPRIPRRVVVVFQPHRYSRMERFLEDFAEALAAADAVLIPPLYPAGESPSLSQVDSSSLAERVASHGCPTTLYRSLENLAVDLMDVTRPDDLVMVMGAGDVNRLHGLLLDAPLQLAA